MADFDLAGARQHYQDSQIADYLGNSRGFDTAGARKAGFTDQQIIDHVMGMQHPAAAAAPKPAANAEPPDLEDHTILGDIGHNALGAAQIAGASVANIPGSIANAGADFLARATGHTQGAHPVPMVQPGQAGRDFSKRGSELIEQGIEATGAGDTVARGVGATDEAVRTAAENHPALANAAAAAGDVAALAGARGMAGMKIAPGVEATVPGAVSRAVRGTTAAAGDEAQAAARAAANEEYTKAGFKTGNAGKVLAGDTTQPTLVNNNSDVFNSIGNAEARVPHGTPLSAESLEAAREPMNGVYDRVGKALPEGPLDGPAQIRASKAGADITDAASKQQVENMRQLLMQPMSGEQRVQQLRQFRQEAYSRLGNEGANSVDQQAVGRAQLEMANSIEDHIGRNLPANGDVSLEQFQAARKALAKNYTVQGALRGNDVDPNALARIQRADPQLLDGPLGLAARFANENREVVGLPSRLNAPGVAKDVAGANPLKLGSLASLATAGAGPALGRRLLTGGPAAGRATARAAFPTPLGDEFAPLTPKPPQPPEGMAVAGEGAGGPHGPPPGNNSDLASVMSHGVEQPSPPGLTAGPMGAPKPEGLPFQRNAAHEAGDLSLGDLVADLHRTYGAGSDLPAVMSQGVPEGTMARTAPGARGTRSNQGPGTRLGDVFSNNASGESAASQEAINRGTRDLVQVDPDGNATPILRDVTQVDHRSPKGHLLVDRSSGEIVDRGGLNKQMAEGLRNRWASRVRLGDTFAPPRE